MNAENVPYFDSFGIEHIRKEIRKLIRTNNITMSGYFCIGTIDFMLKD